MNKYLISSVIIVVILVAGWMFYQNNKSTTYTALPTPTPLSTNSEIDAEQKNIDEGLNQTNDAEFDVSTISDTNLGL